MESSHRWVRVSRDNLCPVCGKPDNCEVSSDGGVVWCGRVSEGSVRENAGGQYLHRLKHDRQPPSMPPVREGHRKSAPRDYSGLAWRLYEEGGEGRQRLSELLGVKETALVRLQVGWDRWNNYWSFPERDGHGKVIGINARHLSGEKKRLFGGKSGLTYAQDRMAGEGPILLVEGGSDSAALMGIGLNVVGRPSNRGGVGLLTELLRAIPTTREIIVIGERDAKPDGNWPGREGAICTARGLSEALDRSVGWSLPPDHAKDSRDWLLKMPTLPDHRLAALFLSGLETTVIPAPPKYSPEPQIQAAVALDDWRRAMLQARIEVLQQPGCYLDSSTTGSGKSHVDFAAIIHLIGAEAA